MRPAIRNLLIHIAEDFSETYRLRIKASGELMQLAGWTGKAEMRLKASDVTPLATFLVNVDAVAQTVTISLDSATIAAFRLATGVTAVWDLYLIDPAGKAKPYMEGQVAFKQSATRIA